jgi:hypothetical protein
MSACGETSQHLTAFSHPWMLQQNTAPSRVTHHPKPFDFSFHEPVAHCTRARCAQPQHVCTAGWPPDPITRGLGLEAGGSRAAPHHMGCLPACLPAPTVPGPARNLISTPRRPRPSLPGPTCRPGPRQRHRAMPPAHLVPAADPAAGHAPTRHHLKTRHGGGESLVATTLYNHGSPCLTGTALFNSTQSFSPRSSSSTHPHPPPLPPFLKSQEHSS